MSGQSAGSNSGAESNESNVTNEASGATSTQSIRDTLPVGAKIGPYEIYAILGAGGFGKVYLSKDPQLGKEVAIKEFFPESHARRINSVVEPLTNSEDSFEVGKRQFLREAQTIAAYNHHSIVEIFGILDANNTHYMVMEYLGEKTLNIFCAENGGKLNWPTVTNILVPLLDALSIVHESGKIHRDISPDNVMIRSDGSPVLLDFGNVRDALLEDDLAKRSRRVSKSTAIVNDGFSPFELYSSNKSDLKPATDIYSLSAVFYLALTGIRPASSTARAEDAIENGRELRPDGPLKPFSSLTLNGPFPVEFLSSLESGLSLRQVDRPQSIPEWRESLFADVRPTEDKTSGNRIRNLVLATSMIAITTGLGYWAFLPPETREQDEPSKQVDVQPQVPNIESGELNRIAEATNRLLEDAKSKIATSIATANGEIAVEGDVHKVQAVLVELEQIEAALQKAIDSKDLDGIKSAQVAASKANSTANELEKSIQVAVNDIKQNQEIVKAKVEAVSNRAKIAANEAIEIAQRAKVAAATVEGVDEEIEIATNVEISAREAIASADTALNELDVAVAEEARKKAEAALDNANIALNQINSKSTAARETAIADIDSLDAEFAQTEQQAQEAAERVRLVATDSDARLADIDAALAGIQSAKSSLSGARQDVNVSAANGALADAKTQLAIIIDIENQIIAERQGEEIAAKAKLDRAVENVNATLTGLQETIATTQQQNQDPNNLVAELGDLTLAAEEIEKLKISLSEASNENNLDGVKNIQSQVEELKNKVEEVIVAIETKKNNFQERINQALAAVEKNALESQGIFSSVEEQAKLIPDASLSLANAQASIEAIKVARSNLEEAASRGDLGAVEENLEQSRGARSEFDVAIADIRTRLDSFSAQAQQDAEAAAEAVAAIEALQKDAQNEASSLDGVEAALDKIEQALTQAREAAQQASDNATPASLDVTAAARSKAESNLEDARLALQEIRDAAAAVTAANASRVAISQLNGEQRTGLYRGLFELEFLKDQEISEEFIVAGEPDPLIQEAVLAFNRASNNAGRSDLSNAQLQEIIGASKGATPWEIERTIPILRSVSERSLWDYGINRQLGQRPFTIIPQISQGALEKNRPSISQFQSEIGQTPNGFFANGEQLIAFLDRPISISVTPDQGEASVDWYYSETDRNCSIWTYANQVEGVYLRPDLPLIVIKKNKQEETPEINVSFGPSNAFVSNSVSLTSNAGTSATLTTSSAGLGIQQNEGLADKTAITALKNDRTISVSGKSIFGTPLTIQYSARGFQDAFSKIEQNCTLEVGFWTE